jgi:hypothetical protein
MSEPRQYGYDNITYITMGGRQIGLNDRHFVSIEKPNMPFGREMTIGGRRVNVNENYFSQNQRKKALLFLTMVGKN